MFASPAIRDCCSDGSRGWFIGDPKAETGAFLESRQRRVRCYNFGFCQRVCQHCEGSVHGEMEIGRLRSSGSITPLHLASVTGHGRTQVIRELPCICHASIGGVTLRGEATIHLTVKNIQLEAFKILVESFKHSNIKDPLNAEHENDNTVLHLSR